MNSGQFKKGQVPWNKGKKGLQVSKWNGQTVPHLKKFQFKCGENHPRWKGGLCRDKHSITSPEYKKWRNAVFKRDNFTCQICFGEDEKVLNKKKNPLEAHHIKFWSEYPDLRYDVDNGITMCDECHFGFHTLKEI